MLYDMARFLHKNTLKAYHAEKIQAGHHETSMAKPHIFVLLAAKQVGVQSPNMKRRPVLRYLV
jgi:hypothetical protein